jgi:hypothetical protein
LPIYRPDSAHRPGVEFYLIFEFFSIPEFTSNFKNSSKFVEKSEKYKLNLVGILMSSTT